MTLAEIVYWGSRDSTASQWSPTVPIGAVFAASYTRTWRGIVYLIHDAARPLYVGCTTKPLRERLRQHSEPKSRSPVAAIIRDARFGGGPALICWMDGTTSDEARLIKRLRPQFNKLHPRWSVDHSSRDLDAGKDSPSWRAA